MVAGSAGEGSGRIVLGSPEVSTRCRTDRFDLLVFDEAREPVLIIEVKKKHGNLTKKSRQSVRLEHRCQLKTYRAYKIPVTVVEGMAEARRFIRKVERLGLRDWIGFVN